MSNPFLAGMKEEPKPITDHDRLSTRITKLERAEGVWHANLTVAGKTMHVIRDPAWRGEKDANGIFNHVKYEYARMLEEKVKTIVGRERREVEEKAKEKK